MPIEDRRSGLSVLLLQVSTSDQIRGNSPTLGGPSHGVNPQRPTARPYTARGGTIERVSRSGADCGPAKPSRSVVLPPWRLGRHYMALTTACHGGTPSVSAQLSPGRSALRPRCACPGGRRPTDRRGGRRRPAPTARPRPSCCSRTRRPPPRFAG